MAGRRPFAHFTWTLLIALISSSHFSHSRELIFGEDNPTYDVLEGDTVQLVCSHAGQSPIDIKRNGINPYDISKSQPTEDIPDNFFFREENSTCILTIEDISVEYDTKYTCIETNVQQLTLRVMYRPSNRTPVCVSNYFTNQIGYDAPDVYHFTCTTEEADPPVQMSMFIYDKNGTKRNLTSYAELSKITLTYQSNHSSFSNQSRFVCEASQEFPSPYEDHTYTRECSLDVSVPSFSVTIEPSNPTVDQGESVTLTCASNISSIPLEWTKVPDNCVENNTVLEPNLTMTCSGSFENAKIDVNCTGSHSGITTFNSTSISVRALESGTEHFETKSYFAVVPAITLLILGILMLTGVAFQSRRKRLSTKNNHNRSTTVSHNVSVNNSNDSPHHTEEANQNELRLVGNYASSQPEMEENPIYEPFTEESPTCPGYHGNTTTSGGGGLKF